MVSPKPTTHPTAAYIASRALIVGGIVIFLFALVDMIIQPIPYQWGDRTWQIAFAAQVIDRGLVPLVGLGMLFTGHWIDTQVEPGRLPRPPLATARFWAAVLASLLGLLYIVLFPLHLNNVRANNEAAQLRLAEEVEQTQAQLEQQFTVEVQRQRAQIEQLIAAPDEDLDQAVQANLITQEQVNLVRDFRENPDALDPFLQQQVQAGRAQAEEEIQQRQELAQNAAQIDTLKSGLRVGIGSLLLAIGYITIGWTALRLMGSS
ncbi:MAG: HpsJ family protein [Kaiparowitsia implicata GSE-PSE-MK54-09C]|jgi:hypothetical protein|nr:HpsJ family protein [Kaiparowitsia implicata GSE-PSE-MK54-09C]